MHGARLPRARDACPRLPAHPARPSERASTHCTTVSLLTGARLSLRLSLLDRSRSAEGDLERRRRSPPSAGSSLGDLGTTGARSLTSSRHLAGRVLPPPVGCPLRLRGGGGVWPPRWPVLVEHASSEAAGVAIVSIWASMARASMCGRPCEEREARSEDRSLGTC